MLSWVLRDVRFVFSLSEGLAHVLPPDDLRLAYALLERLAVYVACHDAATSESCGSMPDLLTILDPSNLKKNVHSLQAQPPVYATH